MAIHHMNRAARDLAVEQSLDAAIEIEQVIRGEREDSPHLRELVASLIGTNREEGSSRKDLMRNSQFSSLYYRATKTVGSDQLQQEDILSLLLAIDGVGLKHFKPAQLAIVRKFCLGLNRELVSESYSRVPEPPMARARNQRLTSRYGQPL